MSTQSWQSFFSRWVWGSESNMFLYYLILRGWLGLLKLVGVAPNEVLLRLPSAVFAVGAAVVVFALGRRLFGRIAGLVAGGLFLANFLQMILAQTARAYSLGLLLMCVSWLALFIALEK
ncbi:MAG TPA: glycosyltransferase family 39 protein, partial [Methylomirabilota bacterium]|nr:glycosyltransferase family 39 protein [Methylomirabilota bacterium]